MHMLQTKINIIKATDKVKEGVTIVSFAVLFLDYTLSGRPSRIPIGHVNHVMRYFIQSHRAGDAEYFSGAHRCSGPVYEKTKICLTGLLIIIDNVCCRA